MSDSSYNQQSGETKLSTTLAWLLLSLAVCFEIAGAIGLRFSEGFSLLLPTVLALGAFTLALYLVSHVMKSLPVRTAYPVWAGVAMLGVLALHEKAGHRK